MRTLVATRSRKSAFGSIPFNTNVTLCPTQRLKGTPMHMMTIKADDELRRRALDESHAPGWLPRGRVVDERRQEGECRQLKLSENRKGVLQAPDIREQHQCDCPHQPVRLGLSRTLHGERSSLASGERDAGTQWQE